MKLVVSYKNLKTAISICEKVTAKSGSLPILNNILLKTENGRLRIAATNLEIGVNYYIGAKIEDQGEITIPSRIFSDFVNNITDDKVSLSVKNNTLHINSTGLKTQILGSSSKDFPIIPKIKTEPVAVLPSKIIRNALISVIDSVSLSEARPELSGIFVNFTDKNIYFVATDSFRLAEKIISNKNSKKNSVIIPRVTALELIRITSEIEGDVSLRFNDNQISVSNDDLEFVSRLIDGNYPDYKKIIPDKFISYLTVDKNELDKKVRLAGLFASNISDIKILCDKDFLEIISKNQDKGEININLKGELKTDPFDLSLNYHYLLDGLKIIPTDKVVFEYIGKGSPVILRPENNKDVTYLIMPLRN